jgi:hypothetical protein
VNRFALLPGNRLEPTSMKPVLHVLAVRLSDESFDARLGQLACSLAGVAILPLAFVAVTRHAGSRADMVLGSGLACLLSLLCILLGMISRRNVGFPGRLTLRSRWPELTSYVGCLGTLFVGFGLLADPRMTPAQITLGLMVTCALSLGVLVLGMTTTLLRNIKG